LSELTSKGQDRGVKRKYFVNSDESAANDMYVDQYMNGILVVGLAPSHSLRRDGAPKIKAVRYRDNVDTSGVHGKRNKGAMQVRQQTPLADVEMSDGTATVLHAGVNARLVELNERFGTDPDCLQSDPEDTGFLAILQPKTAKEWDAIAANLLDETAYATKRGIHGSSTASPCAE